MKDTLSLLEIMTNAAPLVLTSIILAAALIAFLYVMVKIIVPALHELVQLFNAQRQSWKDLLDEQYRINKRLTEDLQADLDAEKQERIKLERRVAESERELEKKTEQLEKANRRIEEMQAELDEVRVDRQKITEERDKLRLEVDQLHREVNQLRTRLNELPATTEASGDGKPKPPAKEGDNEKKSS